LQKHANFAIRIFPLLLNFFGGKQASQRAFHQNEGGRQNRSPMVVFHKYAPGNNIFISYNRVTAEQNNCSCQYVTKEIQYELNEMIRGIVRYSD